jgi:RimJ/RimL family protein N-acetyltransferase
MTISIKPVSHADELRILEELAETIWREHYTPIIGSKQVDYMLDKFQSAAAMRQQIDQQGYHYFAIYSADQMIGYFAVQPREAVLFLSKLYLKAEQRGRGLAKQALNFIEQFARRYNLSKIELTVNKYNRQAIAAYQQLGFQIMQEAVFDIGAGFIMDDYVMQRRLTL